MKKMGLSRWFLGVLCLGFGLLVSCQHGAQIAYEQVEGDPMGTRIYTLDNGLKVYLSVNTEEPRIETSIVVRVGSKQDPAETTGLSHYLEHLMFKGTKQFGTMNYEKEKPLLDQIETLYEEYRLLTAPEERAAHYKIIDSISYEASKYAIPNEYDKLMAAIGSKGTNAYTSNDVTAYVESIPSNQVENWAKVQADRFKNMVIRGFHTELEAVYEEKNISMDSDQSRQWDSIAAMLFPDHPYGTQTTLGTQQHLKNPSIVNIKKHFDKYYVANNIAICMAGDLDPDKTIAIIQKYFGSMRRNDDLKDESIPKSPEITEPRSAEVYGKQGESLALAWRLPPYNSEESVLAEIVTDLLYNGQAGLLDVDINQQMQALSSYAFYVEGAEYSILFLGGEPLEGQKLEQVKDLFLTTVHRIREGNFSDTLLRSVVNNARYKQMRELESNRRRVSDMTQSFITQTPWEQQVRKLDRMAQVQKQQVVDFARKYLRPEAYVVSYKRLGENTTREKIDKPAITPIMMNRDTVSDFVRRIQESKPTPIEPQFVDFGKAITRTSLRDGVELIISKNRINSLFSVSYTFDFGSTSSRTLKLASNYLDYLASDSMSLREFQDKLYALGAEYYMQVTDDECTLTISGLNEGVVEALKLVEQHIRTLKADKRQYKEYAQSILKERAYTKLSQNANFRALLNFAQYGPKNPMNTVLSNAEVLAMDPQRLVNELRSLFDYPHTVIFYTPDDEVRAKEILAEVHPAPKAPKEKPEQLHKFVMRQPAEKQVFFANYDDAVQVHIAGYTSQGELYKTELEPYRQLFNSYFGGSMNAIVFQELREARALAYNAGANYVRPGRIEEPYFFYTSIGTQVDKMGEAMAVFEEIVRNMPLSEKSFEIAKESLIASIRAKRYTPRSIPWLFISLKKLGLESDPRKTLFEQVQEMTLQQVLEFQQKHVKDCTFNHVVLGNKKAMDFDELGKYGKIQELTQKELFGY